MFLVFSVGLILWLVYGILTNSWPVIMANAVTLALSMGILLLKMRYDRREPAMASSKAK
jgi:MtN3 and saliva related transmembrane protein